MDQETPNHFPALTAIVARHQTTPLFGDEREQAISHAVLAGIVAATKELLPAERFVALMREWEIDPILLTAFLELAGGESDNNQEGAIEA